MKFGILGTGVVGRTISSKLIDLGYDVMMGSRTSDNEHAVVWAAEHDDHASHGTFADAAAYGEIIAICTSGVGTHNALKQAGAENLAGKILIDITNPLDFSAGMPPTLSVCNSDSLAEQIQEAYPDAHVVKALNTLNCEIMVNPNMLSDEHDVFVCGNDSSAKDQVIDLLREFGWPSGRVNDLGNISAARGLEMYLPLWLRMLQTLRTGIFNIKVVR